MFSVFLRVAAVGLASAPLAWAQSWQLVWQDESNGSIGPSWVFETGNGASGWGNNEMQYYRRENATIENNALVITAKREDFAGFRYTSARMKTQGLRSFKFGRIEARMKLPAKLGLWPAFWMLGSNIGQVGWPASGEIDVMEQINANNEVLGTVHWQGSNGAYASYGGRMGVNVQDWHVYAVEWDANFIRWFVDGQQYHVIDITNGVGGTEEFHRDFFLLLNMAVGGNLPGFNVEGAGGRVEPELGADRALTPPHETSRHRRLLVVRRRGGEASDTPSPRVRVRSWCSESRGSP